MSISLKKEQGFYFMQRTSLETPFSAQKSFKCLFQGNARRQECLFHLRRNKGFYFMQQTSLKTPIPAEKRFECSFQGNA